MDSDDEIEPDGGLCHITSKAKHIMNNVQIVKVSQDELLNPADPQYKLVFIGEKEDDNESLSEKSEEEAFQELISLENSIKLRSENVEKDIKTQETTSKPGEITSKPQEHKSKHQDKKITTETLNPKYRSNKMSRHRHKYSGPRKLNSSGKGTKPYNRLNVKPSSQDIEPWLVPPQIGNFTQSGIYGQFSSVAEPSLNNLAKKQNQVGLLGDSPYTPHFPQHDFQHRNQSNNFPRQDYWDCDYPSQYQRPVQIMQGPANKKYYKHGYWKNKGRSRSRWNENHNESQQNRRGNTEHFGYRK